MINLYLKSGYLDFSIIDKIDCPFIFIYGPRGVGKTYSALEWVKLHEIPFMFTRRTQSELDLISKPDFFPFGALNTDHNWHVGIKSLTKYNSAFYDQEQSDDGSWDCIGSPIGYTSALSTIANIRGFDASDLKWWIYDEFIPEGHIKKMKDEGAAFLNAYETMNRNRELNNKKPLQCICLANSNRLANPIFMELGLVEIAEKMERKNWNQYIDPEHRYALINTFDSPISEKKKETVLYRLANKNSAFYKMAIENTFSDTLGTMTVSRNLHEYKALVKLGELTIYRHKSEQKFFISMHSSGSPKEYGISENEVKRFLKTYHYLWGFYVSGKVEFETYLCEALWNKYIT